MCKTATCNPMLIRVSCGTGALFLVTIFLIAIDMKQQSESDYRGVSRIFKTKLIASLTVNNKCQSRWQAMTVKYFTIYMQDDTITFLTY